LSGFGAVNGHLIGIAMKEAVRRALTTIRRERFRFAVESKAGYDGADDDMVTSADRAAQPDPQALKHRQTRGDSEAPNTVVPTQQER